MKFRKKPVVIEAMQFFPDQLPWPEGVYEDCATSEAALYMGATPQRGHFVDTLEGRHIASPGDWIITGVKGERYPCKPDIFAMTYEDVEILEKHKKMDADDLQEQKKIIMRYENALQKIVDSKDEERGIYLSSQSCYVIAKEALDNNEDTKQQVKPTPIPMPSNGMPLKKRP